MNELWRSRGQWDRRGVMEGVREVLEDVLADMRSVQGFGPGSWEAVEQ